MNYHHRIYPDIVTFDRDKVLARVKELGYNPAEFQTEADLLHGKEGRYNGFMDLVRDIRAYDFKDDKGDTHLVPAVLFVTSKEAE